MKEIGFESSAWGVLGGWTTVSKKVRSKIEHVGHRCRVGSVDMSG